MSFVCDFGWTVKVPQIDRRWSVETATSGGTLSPSPFIHQPLTLMPPNNAAKNNVRCPRPPLTLGHPVFTRQAIIQEELRQYLTHDCVATALSHQTKLPMKEPLVARFKTVSPKVFVGGVPPDITVAEIQLQFMPFGKVTVDWPKRTQRCQFPPQGYVFLLFDNEHAVGNLLQSCQIEDHKFYYEIKSQACREGKTVQVRPWFLSHCEDVVDDRKAIDWNLTTFVGGIPRPMKARELSSALNRVTNGGVVATVIDVDMEHGYPKGSGRVHFASRGALLAALRQRFISVETYEGSGTTKKIELKPYVVDHHACDNCGYGTAAPSTTLFCQVCCKYACVRCWAILHSVAHSSVNNHRPLFKHDRIATNRIVNPMYCI